MRYVKVKQEQDMKKSICTILLAVALIGGCSFSAKAANNIGDFSRHKGVIGRIGAGIPANAEIGLGYQFNWLFALTAEAYSFSGLTSIGGAVDARWYVTPEDFTPYADLKVGYALLGTNMEYQNCYGAFSAVTAGLSWRWFDLGAGITYDPFHKVEFTASLTWTFNFCR